LARDQIDQSARIVAVADAFDAMTSHRPYRPALPMEAAFFELVSKAGAHFDPNCVQAFLRLRPKIEALLRDKG
jgi:HD-GYP domain-containing protein (c-di-GMP phosphodiesterase class II)